MKKSELKDLLDSAYRHYSSSDFITLDPICVPHSFSKIQDIEISGFFAASLAWGQRITIIRKCKELMELMDGAPHDFILHHSENHLKSILKFKHRTFNNLDLLYFIRFLKYWYSSHESLETAFIKEMSTNDNTVENGLIGFHTIFFSLPDHPVRTYKHIATPLRKSACKRLNMFLRWMVRKDEYGIDFGIWKNIRSDQLVCPFDLHVANVSREFKLIRRKQNDWQAALQLTNQLKKFDPVDPVKYDLALFSIGIDSKNL